MWITCVCNQCWPIIDFNFFAFSCRVGFFNLKKKQKKIWLPLGYQYQH